MTKTEIINIFKELGITLPSSGKTDYMELPQISYITITKLETKFYGKENLFKFDMSNEQIECYKKYPNGKLMTYKDSTTPRMDMFDFSSIVVITPNFSVL